MPFINCQHCGERTFTISGWASADHCPTCGSRLAPPRHGLELPIEARGRLTRTTRGAGAAGQGQIRRS